MRKIRIQIITLLPCLALLLSSCVKQEAHNALLERVSNLELALERSETRLSEIDQRKAKETEQFTSLTRDLNEVRNSVKHISHRLDESERDQKNLRSQIDPLRLKVNSLDQDLKDFKAAASSKTAKDSASNRTGNEEIEEPTPPYYTPADLVRIAQGFSNGPVGSSGGGGFPVRGQSSRNFIGKDYYVSEVFDESSVISMEQTANFVVYNSHRTIPNQRTFEIGGLGPSGRRQINETSRPSYGLSQSFTETKVRDRILISEVDGSKHGPGSKFTGKLFKIGKISLSGKQGEYLHLTADPDKFLSNAYVRIMIWRYGEAAWPKINSSAEKYFKYQASSEGNPWAGLLTYIDNFARRNGIRRLRK